LYNERRHWRFTRDSVPFFRVSYPKCLFDSPVSRPTRTFWLTRKLGRRPSATFSSVRLTFNCPLWVCLIDFRFFDVNSWLGRWCYGSCRRRVSDGGREDSAAGTDALPCRSSGDSPVPKRWTRRVQDYPRGGFQGFIPWSFPDSSQASYKPR